MSEYLTREEIESRYVSEWVLIGEPQVTEQSGVVGGVVLFHSKVRDEMYNKAIELQPKRFATLFTGPEPADVYYML